MIIRPQPWPRDSFLTIFTYRVYLEFEKYGNCYCKEIVSKPLSVFNTLHINELLKMVLKIKTFFF